MKNQNDLIFSIAFGVVGLGAIAAFFFMKPTPVTPPGPTTVNTAKVDLPKVEPAMADSLGGGTGSSRSGGMGGFGGPPSGFGGPPGMMPRGGPGGAPGGVAGGKRMGGVGGD